MYIFKKLQILMFLSFLILFSGCVRNLDTNGLTLKIDESELNKSASDKFPIRKSFVVANVEIDKPNIYIKENTNKIAASLDINLVAIFIPKTKGSLQVSGKPYFDKTNSYIYLRDVSIEKIDFSNSKVAQKIPTALLSSLAPLIDEIFKKVPIYKIKKDSWKGSFVKDMKVENSELLVTFGL